MPPTVPPATTARRGLLHLGSRSRRRPAICNGTAPGGSLEGRLAVGSTGERGARLAIDIPEVCAKADARLAVLTEDVQRHVVPGALDREVIVVGDSERIDASEAQPRPACMRWVSHGAGVGGRVLVGAPAHSRGAVAACMTPHMRDRVCALGSESSRIQATWCWAMDGMV